MSAPVRSIRLSEFHSSTLDRNTYSSGEIFYDLDNKTLRIMNGRTAAGTILATQNYVNSTITSSLAAVDVSGKANLSGATFTGAVSSPGFTGPLTGNVTGNLTGNVTGNLTGNVTGNASTATKFAASKTINGVAFDGSVNISVSTLVNGANTATLGVNGSLTLPNGLINTYPGQSFNANSITLSSGQAWVATTDGSNFVGVDSTTAQVGVGANLWTFGANGTLTAAGNISTDTGTVAANAVTTTNDITVGGNAVISTAPTLTTHATNKKYVDKKAVAMAVALG